MEMQGTETSNGKLSFNVEPIGFEMRINYAAMYHLYMQKLNDIHAEGRFRDAISYFNMMVVPAFGGIFDSIYIKNCQEIIDENDNYRTIYMLHRVEFGRLMTRSGIAPKPDIRIRYKAMWDAPKTLKDLSFDGSNKNKGDVD